MALSKIDTAAIATDAIEAAQLKSDAIALTDLPSGGVIQAVKAVTNNPSSTQTTSTSYIALNSTPTCTITPKFAGSTIIVYCGGAMAHYNNPANYGPSYNIGFSVNSGSYTMMDTTGPIHGIYKNAQDTNHWEDHVVHMQFAHSPSYTLGNSIAYKMYGRKTNNGTDTWLNHHGGIGSQGPGSASLYIIAMEVRA